MAKRILIRRENEGEWKVDVLDVRREPPFLLSISVEEYLTFTDPEEGRRVFTEERALAIVADGALREEGVEALIELLKDLLEKGFEPERAYPLVTQFWMENGCCGADYTLSYFDFTGARALSMRILPKV